MSRLISCSKCGRIHPYGECPLGGKRSGTGSGHPTIESKFRSSNKWTQKSRSIRERDHWLCQACLHDLDGQGTRYTTSALEVHHIISIEEDYSLRLDESNLITLCRQHHEEAEQGKLDKQALQEQARSNSTWKG